MTFLAVNQNAGLRLQLHIFDPEPHQFRHPQATREAKMKHRSVADAVPDRWVRGIQDRLHLLSGEMPDKPSVRLFRRDGQNPLDLLQCRRYAIFHVVHERLDGCEPDVSGTSAIATTGFQMVQEVHDERSIQLFQLQLRWRQFEANAGVFEQKPESMRIGVAGVGAGTPLDW
jgi:hypothetical protein